MAHGWFCSQFERVRERRASATAHERKWNRWQERAETIGCNRVMQPE